MSDDDQTTLKLPPTEVLPIDEVVPYFRNPRVISEEAVEAVRKSIDEFRYQQPIAVDTDHVVIVGHTRLQALRQLGYTEIPVYVSDLPEQKAKEYRLADNRISEMSSWEHQSLVMELREWEKGLLDFYFPEVDLEIQRIEDAGVTQDEIDRAAREVAKVEPRPDLHLTKVECPACYGIFEVKTATLPGLTHDDMVELTSGGAE